MSKPSFGANIVNHALIRKVGPRHRLREIDTEHKKKKLLEAYAKELLRKFPEWENLQVKLVAGAGFEPAAFRL